MFKSFLQRLTNRANRKTARQRIHRGLRLERLDKRSLLAADIGSIVGTTYVDLNGNSAVDAGEARGGVTVQLFRDGGNGTFQGTGGGTDDTLVGTVISDPTAGATLGQYNFANLTDGTYFVSQTTATGGLAIPTPVTVTIANRIASIDNFLTGAQTATANTGNPTVADSVTSTGSIGGERDVQATRSAGIGSYEILVDTTTGQLSVSAGGGTSGTALIQYDGIDGSINLNPVGLNRASLGGGTPGQAIDPATILFLNTNSEPGATLTIRVFTDAVNFSTITQTIPTSPDAVTFQNTSILLSSFAIGGGTGADFNDVGAIEAIVTSPAGIDSFVRVVETARPDIKTANLRNLQPLTIGDLIFQDNNNNGLFDGGDVGLSGVDVELYSLPDLNGVVDPATQTPVATTTSGTAGAYSFANVTPGFYAIVIPAREFDATSNATGARTLVGFQTSTPTPETAGANANVNNDDDGRAVAGQLYVASGAFQLVSGDEPTTGGGNTNNTFDFGFVSNADLGITKTFVSLTTATDGTRTATFRVDVINNGPLTATGVTVVDTIPSGLTFFGISSTTSATTPPAGVVSSAASTGGRTFNLIDLGSTVQTSFNVIFTVNANTFTDQTNTVTVDGDQNDTDLTNNTDDALLDLPQTDLTIVKTLETTAGNTIPPATARTGDTVVYRLVVSNLGPDNATGVSVVDTLPDDVTFVSGTINGTAAGTRIVPGTTNPRQLTIDVGAVTTVTPVVVLLTVTVNSNSADLITNTATVSNFPDTDANTANDTSSVSNGITRAIDLAVLKSVSTSTADNTTAIFGAPVTFVITVSNPTATSPGDSRGFTVTDTLPTGLTLVANSFDAGTSGVTFASSGQALTFTGGALARGASVSFTFDALVAQSAGTTITNTAVVAPISNGTITDVDNNAANNTDDEIITPLRNIELVVRKSSNFSGTQTPTPGGVTTDTSSATPGGNITYTILVTNSGPSDAVNVNVVDTLPAGVTATSITVGGSQVTDNDPTAGTLAFVLPSVPVGTTGVTVLVSATIAATTTGNITNSVTVSGGGTGDLPAGNTASVVTPLTPMVDVAIAKTGPATAVPGSTTNISYTLTVTNATGPSAATNVTVTDTLPTGVTFQSATLNGAAVTPTIAGQVLTFTIPTIAVGSTGNQTIVINARVADTALTGTIVNNSTVTATGDSNPNNNTASFTTTLAPSADIAVTKAVSTATSTPGGTLTYTIQVSNAGVSTAAGVTLTDVLPTGLTFISGTGPNGQVLTATGQTVNFAAIGTLAPTTTPLVYTIVATIGSTFTGTLQNTAMVTTTTAESNTANNTAQVSTTVTDPDPNTGSITGRVFRDNNNDGLFQSSDVGIPGVTLRLRTAGTTAILQTTTTDSTGAYAFANLAAGSYEVVEVQPAGLTDGLEQAGTNATPTNTANDTITPITVTRGTASPGFNFAETESLSKRRFLASSGS